ncbi:MAG: M55 family metallopeptidase [Candidatus Omnitrophica bacterium]|nr:M55 family metallopeptidase [Candidatus Omnitrophota bacterium]
MKQIKKVYIMTDMEGVAGVIDFENWCSPSGRYYELAKELLTLEVNSCIDGLFEAGVEEIIVLDGHGPGGINIKLLDPRVKMQRGWPRIFKDFFVDTSFDAVVWVGQHAKAGTEYAHLPHTQSCHYIDLSVNGISIGEFGQAAMVASELGIRAIFGSGDYAFTKEASQLVPGIETVAVKWGLTPGKGDECTYEQYKRRNTSAIHLHPEKARQLIKEGAYRAVKRAEKEEFGIIPLKGPFERVAIFRPDTDNPKRISKETHPFSVIELFNMPFNPKPVD